MAHSIRSFAQAHIRSRHPGVERRAALLSSSQTRLKFPEKRIVQVLSEQREIMRPLTRSILAFLTCFGVGTLLSALSGFGSRHWFPAGLATSSIVAIYVFRSSQKENAN